MPATRRLWHCRGKNSTAVQNLMHLARNNPRSDRMILAIFNFDLWPLWELFICARPDTLCTGFSYGICLVVTDDRWQWAGTSRRFSYTKITSGYSDVVLAASNVATSVRPFPLTVWGSRFLCNTRFPGLPRVSTVHPKQDLDPCSRLTTMHTRDATRLSVTIFLISRIRIDATWQYD